MSRPWAVRMPRTEVAAAGRLRQTPGIRVSEHGAYLWLRGEALDETLDLRLRQLPGAERFFLLPDEQLLPAGRRVPRGYLPDVAWTPLAAWVVPELPLAALPGNSEGKVAITLVRRESQDRSDRAPAAEEPGVLLTTVPCWLEYAQSAPQVRLDRWTFAASADGRVVVRGVPLPPIAGQRYADREGIAVPAGWTWSPAVDAVIVRRVLGLAEGDVALFCPDGTWERIAADQFVRATRSAARALVGQVANLP